MVDIELENAYKILSQGIAKQVGIYSDVLVISDEQVKAVAENDELKLIELVQAKQKLMDEAREIATKLIPFRDCWDSKLEEAPHDFRQDMKEKVEKLSFLLKEILVKEEDTARQLNEVREKQSSSNSLKNNINKLKSAYGNVQTNRFMDKKK